VIIENLSDRRYPAQYSRGRKNRRSSPATDIRPVPFVQVSLLPLLNTMSLSLSVAPGVSQHHCSVSSSSSEVRRQRFLGRLNYGRLQKSRGFLGCGCFVVLPSRASALRETRSISHWYEPRYVPDVINVRVHPVFRVEQRQVQATPTKGFGPEYRR
jgi:hypothetical protein